jgi:16S rRNA (cytidine1402-2'-O)-methyltransferase
MSAKGLVYLIPVLLHDDGINNIPPEVMLAANSCSVFFVENERTARRFLRKMQPDFSIDDRQWHSIHKAEDSVKQAFRAALQAGKIVGIMSEAGCPGIADPGQLLVAEAQKMGITVRPLTGPSSILLALMASGLNGQRFQFHGYLPIETAARQKAIRELETYSQNTGCTQLFIETPYRNQALFETLLRQLRPGTRLCLAVDLTSPTEFISTQTIADWKKQAPELHKRPALFLIQA